MDRGYGSQKRFYSRIIGKQIKAMGKRREDMEIENERDEMTLTVRDSLNGNKLYEIIRLNGEAEVFDYIMGLKRKVRTSELYQWLKGMRGF